MAIVILLLAVSAYGAGPLASQSGVEVRLRFLSEHDGVRDFEITATNKSSASVYIMTKPRRSDRSSGPYFVADERDATLLRCEFRAYPPPPYSLYFNDTHIELKRLGPGEENREVFSIKVPVTSTIPPYGSEPSKPVELGNRFQSIKAVVGVLPDTARLNKLFEKLGTHWVTGLEPVVPEDIKGPKIFEAQTLLMSNAIDF